MPDKPEEIIKKSTVIDTCVVSKLNEGMIDYILESGYNLCNYTSGGHANSMLSAMLRMEETRWIEDKYPDKVKVIENQKDMETVIAEDRKLGIIMNFQGAEPLTENYHLLQIFQRLGLLVLGLTYNNRNQLGDGCLEPENRGLTHLGIEFVRNCNDLGIVVDLSHAGDKTAEEALELSEKPCILSHSNPRGLHDNPRNATDQQIKTLAQKGGVIGLSVFSDFVGDTKKEIPSRSDYLQHFDYVIDLVGIDHVGIGTDLLMGAGRAHWWDNNTKRRSPEVVGGMTFETHEIYGYREYKEIYNLVDDMLKHGYKENDIQKILGGNFLRVYREVLPQ